MRFEFYGGSDDIISIRVDGLDVDEVGGFITDDGRYSRAVEVRSVGGAMGVRVHAIYDGCWSFAAGLIEDGRGIPNGWTIGTDQEHEYSTRLVIDTGGEQATVTAEDGAPLHEDEQ